MDIILKAVLNKVAVWKHMYSEHDPTADEINDRNWLNMCVVLSDRIKELEAELLHENDLFLTQRNKAEELEAQLANADNPLKQARAKAASELTSVKGSLWYLKLTRRNEELEAQLDEYRGSLTDELIRTRKLEAQLAKVRGSPEKWRKDPTWETLLERSKRRKCANELEQAMESEDG